MKPLKPYIEFMQISSRISWKAAIMQRIAFGRGNPEPISAHEYVNRLNSAKPSAEFTEKLEEHLKSKHPAMTAAIRPRKQRTMEQFD